MINFLYDFLYDFTATWFHIFLGISLMGFVCIAVYFASSSYYRYLDKKEETEMERMRKAMSGSIKK